MSGTNSRAAMGTLDVGTLIPIEPPHQVGLAIYAVGAEADARLPLAPNTTVTIGRDAGCEFVLDHPMISRRHAAVHVGEQLVVEDLRSANGTSIGRHRLAPGERRVLEVEESFQLG